jgi:CRP-like cAMP-binding protein
MIALLRRVDFLSALDDATLEELANAARVVRYASGDRIVSELEAGADVFVLIDGEAEVFVEPRAGEKQILGTLKAGSALGEMSSLTGELRSATVVAKGPVESLVIADAVFDRLRERRPEIAVALVRTLAKRLAEADRAVEALTSDTAKPAAVKTRIQRGSVGRVWRELVVSHHRELPFLTLVSFVATLVFVRLAVFASFHFDFAPRIVLRVAYMSGFGLLVFSAAAALLTFRPIWRKLVAIAYGIGGALIFNELGVTLAFDIYFRDIHTPDPNVAFDVERLYRRTEPLRAIAIGLVVLLQAVYLRRFYRRVWFIAKTRARKAFAR